MLMLKVSDFLNAKANNYPKLQLIFSGRPTEIPECDVFIVDHKVNGDPRAQGQYMTYVSTRNYRKLKVNF